MSDANKVSAGKPKIGGAVFVAPLGTTTIPTDASSELNSAFKNLGYISEDGVREIPTITKEVIRAWGGDTVLTPQTEKREQWGMTFLEILNEDVQKTVRGSENVTGSVSGTSGMKVTHNSTETPGYIWVIDMIMTGGVLHRVLLYDASISAMEEITYSDSAASGYAVTLDSKPNASGNYSDEWFKAPSTSGSGG